MNSVERMAHKKAAIQVGSFTLGIIFWGCIIYFWTEVFFEIIFPSILGLALGFLLYKWYRFTYEDEVKKITETIEKQEAESKE